MYLSVTPKHPFYIHPPIFGDCANEVYGLCYWVQETLSFICAPVLLFMYPTIVSLFRNQGGGCERVGVALKLIDRNSIYIHKVKNGTIVYLYPLIIYTFTYISICTVYDTYIYVCA